MKGIITAAGYSSRLWPLTKDLPKPLLEVKGKPIVVHVIDKICEIPEVDEIIIVTNDKFYSHFEDWLQSFECRVPVKLLNDGTLSNDDRLGQIGDVDFAIKTEKISDDILIVAGDNLFNFSLTTAHELFKNKGAIMNPLYDIKSFSAARQLGTVILDDNNNFLEFLEKSPTPKTTLVSLGVYFFPKQKIDMVSKYLNSGSNADKMGYFIEWLMQNDRVMGHVYKDKWFDIGWIDSLEQARKEFKG